MKTIVGHVKNNFLNRRSQSVCFIVLFLFSVIPFAQGETQPSASIPNNGTYNSDENFPSDPAVYAGILRENMTCLNPECEKQIMIELQMYFINDVEDAYRAYLLGALSDGGSFDDYINKIQGIKVLEDFLRLHHFDKAADFVKARLTAPNPKICLGMEPSTEYSGQYERECQSDEENPNCEKKCMDQSLESLAGQIQDSERRERALDALQDAQLKIHNSNLGICSVKNPNSKNPKDKNQNPAQNPESSTNKKRAQLCGILDSPSVIGALSRAGENFMGGSQSDPAEYRCSYVRIHIDKSQSRWRLHPDDLKHNYVVYADGKTYNLTPDDVTALQNEVQSLSAQNTQARKKTGSVKPQTKANGTQKDVAQK